MKKYVTMTIEPFNRHQFSGDALTCVNALFNIAKRHLDTDQSFVIDTYA